MESVQLTVLEAFLAINAADKYHFLNISLNDFPQARLSSRATPTCEINGHGAFVFNATL